MKQFTPGPWTVQFAIASNPVAAIYADKRGDVAIVHRSSPTQNWSGIETDEAKANATLIAAAPELFKAANDLLAWLREFYADEPLFSSEPNHANVTVTALEAAIAKAEGR